MLRFPTSPPTQQATLSAEGIKRTTYADLETARPLMERYVVLEGMPKLLSPMLLGLVGVLASTAASTITLLLPVS